MASEDFERSLERSYDDAPYPSYPHPFTHPARTSARAAMLGMKTPPVNTARVLEIGCAAGGNIVPMAAALPEARFVGIDISEHQIAEAQGAARLLGLTNI